MDAKVIGLVSPAGGGKDTFYQIASRLFEGVERVAMADTIRLEVEEILGAECPNLWTKETPHLEQVDKLLQLYGTEYRRAEDPHYWSQRTLERIGELDAPVTIVSDVRFPDEAAAVRAVGGKIVFIDCPLAVAVKRRPDKDRSHESEAMANRWQLFAESRPEDSGRYSTAPPWDGSVVNWSTAERFEEEVAWILNILIPGRRRKKVGRVD